MFEFIKQLDLKLFHLINQGLSNPFFDFLMPLFDDPKYWILPILVFWIITMVKDRPNRYKLLILVPVVVILCDQTGAFLKSFELRDRPWFGLGTDVVNHLGGMGGRHKSFPSNHAANIAGLATVLSRTYSDRKTIFWIFAFTIMLSRIYIGVHYPFDVAVGATLGISFGLLLVFLWSKITNSEGYHPES